MQSATAPLSFIEVLEHSLILHCGRGAKERRRKNKGEGFPRAGAVTGGKREGAQCNIPEESEEENAKEKGKGQSEGIGERDEDEQEGCAVGVRTGAARVQRKTETSLTAYPPLLLIDANLESEQDAACWRAPAGVAAQLRRGRGRKETRGTDSRGVRTSDEATREGREESRRCRPSFLGSGFWVKLQPSGEATETERLPRVRQEAFPGAVQYVLTAVLFGVRSPVSSLVSSLSPPKRPVSPSRDFRLPDKSSSPTLHPPALTGRPRAAVNSSSSSSSGASSSSAASTSCVFASSVSSSFISSSPPSPSSPVPSCPSSSSLSSSPSSASPFLSASSAPLSSLFLSGRSVSASPRVCPSESERGDAGSVEGERGRRAPLPSTHAFCSSSPGRQGQAEKSSETRDEGDDDGGEAANVTSPVELRDVEEEERLLLFVRVPEPYLRMRRVPSKSGLEQFSEAGCASTVSARSSCAHSASPSLSSTALVPAARAAHPSLSSSPSSLDALRRVVTAEEAGERGKEGNGRGDAQPEPAGEEKDGGERGTEPARCGNDLGSSGGECREVSGQTSEGENDGTATEERKEAERRPAAEQDSRRKGRPGKNTWLLVNDHVLAYVKEKTVLDFSPSWKIPVLLQFTRADALESPAVVEHLAASPALWERSESDGERGDSDSRPDTRPSLVSQGLSSSRCRGASRAETAAARAVGAEGGNEQTSGTGSENAESARTQSAEMARATPAASFRLFQADKNISLHPLAATHPTTFVPLTHSELVALHRGNGLRLSTALSGRNATKEGDRLSPFSSCASSSLPSSTPLAAALSPSASSWHPRSREAGEDREREKRVEQSASETQVLREAGASGDTKRETASEAAEVERTSGEPTCGARRPDRKEEREVAKPTSFREREPSGDDVENKEQRETGEAKGMEERAELVSSDLADNEEGVHLPRVCPSVRPAAPEDREGKEENEEQRGWLVALDAEFVAEEDCYEDEEALCSLSAPRHRSQPVTRQSLALARVSVLRGEGPQAGVPFIDHYVHFKAAPKDYLTRFSGLRPGDLDLNASQFWLSTKKAIHQKLRYLVDAGCVFVGHGLSQDFRIINLFVPSSQIVDTVELFRLPGRRLLSLKFLAAHLLDLHIQQTTHDSIQDARAALLLYRRYTELRRSGCLEQCIHHLYQIGYSTRWRVPDPPTVLPLSPALPLYVSGHVRSRLSPEAPPFVSQCREGRRQSSSSSLPAMPLEREQTAEKDGKWKGNAEANETRREERWERTGEKEA